MKIAVPSQGTGLDAGVDSRFGRAEFFIVVESETNKFEVVENGQNLNAAQGAGIQSARNVINAQADILITHHVGPKAFAALSAGGVKVFTGSTGTVKEAVEQFKRGELEEAANADVEGHWI